jgi:hypothetical protein
MPRRARRAAQFLFQFFNVQNLTSSFQDLAHSSAISCTFLHSAKNQVLSFQAIPHSFAKKRERG